ncbi:hypothetical protein DYB35_004401 [Aphanomyces astaci]|uniref:Uncharacterized protein n=1 Tax=Aphanomyces astaci TaxID=112090 RepID=A0A3R7A8K7_APHAT|nr:hypothetical protein DYB35_004401 [Aphanomyces astaci]
MQEAPSACVGVAIFRHVFCHHSKSAPDFDARRLWELLTPLVNSLVNPSSTSPLQPTAGMAEILVMTQYPLERMVTALECADTPDPIIVTLLRLSQYMMEVHQPSWSAAPPTSSATAVHIAKTITPSVLMLCDHHPSMSIRRQDRESEDIRKLAADILAKLPVTTTMPMIRQHLRSFLESLPPRSATSLHYNQLPRLDAPSSAQTTTLMVYCLSMLVLNHVESSQDWLPTVLELVLEIWGTEDVTATSSSMTYALPYIHDCLVDQTPPISMLLLSACLKNNKPASATTNLTGTRMSNYGSTHDPTAQRLLATSDKIELTKQTIAEADRTAKHVLVELEAQRGQFTDMKDMVNDTKVATTQANAYLKELRERHLRQKAFLWFIIVVLVVIDLFLFYYFFLRQ